MGLLPLVFYGALHLARVRADPTIYSQIPIQTPLLPGQPYEGLAAYNPLHLDPPPIPNPAPATHFGIQLAASADQVQGLSIPQSGAFFGFSVEMSVMTQAVGLNGSYIHPTFLNLMSLLVERAGRVHVRCGGNTQERAIMVPETESGRAIEKEKIDTNAPTQTPGVFYTDELLWLMRNVSSLLNVKWYLGLPWYDFENFRMDIAEHGERILGDSLLGLQGANEPDLYERHQHRPAPYTPMDYFGEFAEAIQKLEDNPNVKDAAKKLIGPSLATGDWTPEMIWETGFIDAFRDHLHALTVEHYPSDNCAEIYPGFGEPVNPAQEFPNYLDHSAGVKLVEPYLNSARIAQEAGLPFIMFETNTASCGGFSGISQSFGATLWALDYGLQMAYSNFSHALLHVGGQNVYYNPWTAVPTNESYYREWTIGSVFYSVLAVAETFGSSNNSRIIDLNANSGSLHTPGYAIYEDGVATRLALFNYMTDPSGANTYTAYVSIGGGESGQPPTTPTSVKVKYLVAPTIGEHFNITWGGQTLGGMYELDGRMKGEVRLETVQCVDNACPIRVPAPGFALVFLNDDAVEENNYAGTETFETTARTKARNTITFDYAAVATSNGEKGRSRLGSTSWGSMGAGTRTAGVYPSLLALLAVMVGTVATAWMASAR